MMGSIEYRRGKEETVGPMEYNVEMWKRRLIAMGEDHYQLYEESYPIIAVSDYD
jgi:hypothetical protein